MSKEASDASQPSPDKTSGSSRPVPASGGKRFFDVLFAAAATLFFLVAIVLALMTNIDVAGQEFGLTDSETFSAALSKVWIVAISSALLMLLTLFASARRAGKCRDGSIALNAFDRVFVIIQLAFLAGISLPLYPAAWLALLWFARSPALTNFIGSVSFSQAAYEQLREITVLTYNTEVQFHPDWVMLFFAVTVAFTVALADLLIVQSLVKKYRTGTLLRYSLAGWLWRFTRERSSGIAEAFRNVQKSLRFSTVGFLTGIALMAILCRFSTLGVIAAIVLALLLVPRWMNQYLEIREGISEVRSGNLSYQIPYLGEGEFGRVAKDISSIADAQNLAIQNELTNQRMKTELITNVSHDLRTPLTSVVSYVDLLKKEGLTSENAPEYLDILEEKTARLKRLTEDLFEAAKASSGDIPVEMTIIEMNSILNQALAELEENLAANDIHIIRKVDQESIHVMADGRLLWRVIENLLTNIGKYALPGSRAYIDVTDLGDKARMEVKNISRDQLNISAEELLERFKRGDESRNTEGSGLGLTIARDLTRLMGGSFELSIDGDLFKAVIELPKA